MQDLATELVLNQETKEIRLRKALCVLAGKIGRRLMHKHLIWIQKTRVKVINIPRKSQDVCEELLAV